MMLEVFNYTNRIVNMIRPRKLLFMAIGRYAYHYMTLIWIIKWFLTDGVAPRAKMNQQRSRRFRSAQEAKDKAEARKLALAEWEGKLLCTKLSVSLELKLCRLSHGQSRQR